jgi:FixJ family two-component response regulator
MSKTPTPRQKSILELMALGYQNKEIAYRLGLSEGTIKQYVSRIYRDFPDMGGRVGSARVQVRDHERVMAIRLNVWIRQHGEGLSPVALEEIKGIMADQVAPILV